MQKQEMIVTEAQVEEQCTWYVEHLSVLIFAYEALLLWFCNSQILKDLFRN